MGLNIVLAYYFWYVLVSNYKELKTNNNLALETPFICKQTAKTKVVVRRSSLLIL